MVNKANFDKRLSNIPNEIISLIAAIDELKGRWTASANLHPQILGRLKQSVLITSTGASTRIEGSRLSDKNIENLMKGIQIQRFKDRDFQEAKSYHELLENIFNSWPTLKLNESTIKHFHSEILKYVDKDAFHRSQYKQVDNQVRMVNAQGKIIGTIFATTPAYLTPIEIRDLVEWTIKELADKKYHPLFIIGNFIVEFLKIHPFKDGNGRVSRILTNLLLLKAGYLFMPYISHEKIIEDNKSDYYLALRKSQLTFKTKKVNIVPWFKFFLKTVLFQSKKALELLSEETVEKILSQKQLTVWLYLQKVKETSPLEISKNTKVVLPTIKQALKKLKDLKKIERIGLGRGSRYRIIKS
jgi:Fic family protein